MPYHSYEELINLFRDLEKKNPDVVSHEAVGTSTEGRDIYLFKVGRGHGKTLYVGSIHGNERPGAELLYLYAKWLVNEVEAKASEILNRNLTLIVPVANPDNFGRTRKNANGIDCNRNFPHHWCECGSSTQPWSPVYKGPSAKSEPETKAIHRVFLEYNPTWFLSIHTGAEVLAYPWSYTMDRPKDQDYYEKVCSEITSLSERRDVEPYKHGQVPYAAEPIDLAEKMKVRINGTPLVIYCCSGVSMDDSYNNGIYSMVLEATSLYNPPYSEVKTTYFKRLLPIAIILSKESRAGPGPGFDLRPLALLGSCVGLAGLTYFKAP